jgi:hypothetical protein
VAVAGATRLTALRGGDDGVGLGDGEAVGAMVAVMVLVAVGAGVSVAVGVAVGVAVSVGIEVGVSEGVNVGRKVERGPRVAAGRIAAIEPRSAVPAPWTVAYASVPTSPKATMARKAMVICQKRFRSSTASKGSGFNGADVGLAAAERSRGAGSGCVATVCATRVGAGVA